jgi:hypothetical protein
VANVELPAIVKAWQQGNLRIVPVFDGMSPEQASAEVSRRFGIEIGDINGHAVDSNLSPEDNAARIAARLARTHVQDARDRGAPPITRLVSYDDTADLREQAVLNLDWRHRLASGLLDSSDEGRLRSALGTAAGALKEAYGASDITLAVKAHLPLAVALGHALSEPTGCTLRLHRDGMAWTTTRTPTGDTPLVLEEGLKGPADAHVASLAVSISRAVDSGVDDHIRQGNRYRHRWVLTPRDGPGRDAVAGPQSANAWGQQIGVALTTLADRPDIHGTDLFMAAPVEVAVFVGWWANAVGEVNLMNWTDKTGPYRRMWTLP